MVWSAALPNRVSCTGAYSVHLIVRRGSSHSNMFLIGCSRTGYQAGRKWWSLSGVRVAATHNPGFAVRICRLLHPRSLDDRVRLLCRPSSEPCCMKKRAFAATRSTQGVPNCSPTWPGGCVCRRFIRSAVVHLQRTQAEDPPDVSEQGRTASRMVRPCSVLASNERC
jgi:hypothetical protein